MTVRRLADALGLESTERSALLLARGRGEHREPAEQRSSIRTTGPPEPLTSFVGRGSEVLSVRQLVQEVRLLTLVGPGGIGKIESMLAIGYVIPPPDRLTPHVYERFVTSPTFEHQPLAVATPQITDGFDRLDPVCLMEVDPGTARHTVEYQGRTIAFCAPACKTQFVADPSAYLTV